MVPQPNDHTDQPPPPRSSPAALRYRERFAAAAGPLWTAGKWECVCWDGDERRGMSLLFLPGGRSLTVQPLDAGWAVLATADEHVREVRVAAEAGLRVAIGQQLVWARHHGTPEPVAAIHAVRAEWHAAQAFDASRRVVLDC